MAIIVQDAPLPAIYADWGAWRHERRTRPRPGRGDFCAHCWGAGRLFEPAPNGEGLVPRVCPRCGGARTAAA